MSTESPKPLPPGQQLVAPGKWPIIGERLPAQSDRPWTLEVGGLAQNVQTYSLAQLNEIANQSLLMDIHCVTRWSKLGVTFFGIPFKELMERAQVAPEAKFVSFVSRSERKHSTSLLINDAIELGTLIALQVDGQPLEQEHGGPIRNVVPGRYFYKSVKWLEKIEFLEHDRLGMWEAESGYHNTADPWREQRYMAPTIDKPTALKLIQSRDFSDRDLRSIDASDRDLANLNAKSAHLRDANFQGAILTDANFSSANLSNSHFEKSDLTRAQFVGADLEGANLCGADLRGADLTDASLIGASFFQTLPEELSAKIDSTTKISKTSLSPLTPEQQEYVLARLEGN